MTNSHPIILWGVLSHLQIENWRNISSGLKRGFPSTTDIEELKSELANVAHNTVNSVNIT